MKNQRVIILIVVLLIATCALCACNKESRDIKDFISDMKSSTNNVKIINAHISMKDGDVLVYDYQRKMEIDGSTANVETTEQALNSSFQLATNTSSSTMDSVDRSTLLPVSLSEWSVENVSIEKGKFSCDIPVANFASVLKVGSYKIRENATLCCEFDDKNLTKISCNFITDDGKTVAVVYDFAY